MTRRFALSFLLLLPLLVFALFAVSFGLFNYRPIAPAAPVLLTVPSGAPLPRVARQLEDAGVIADAGKFQFLARLRGDTRRAQAGEYEFTEPATPCAVLDRLIAGDVQQRRLTIPEGLTLREIADRLETEGIGPAAEIVRLAQSADFLAAMAIEASSPEGYLFPETYQFATGTGPQKLLSAMVRQFRDRISADIVGAAKERGLTLHELVTLASIIQKEAGNEMEMPVISAVFHNRLRRGIPLQADPTVIYGIEDFDGNLTRKHLRTTTPYNTYRIAGLPPGPIANPGLAALRAAAFPDEVDFLYFVARGDGTHQFSVTLKEHNQAVQRFQLRRR
ncbi:MAG: endolytic transglycosylase MltG [Desulfuromonadales bacterium]